MRFRRLSALVVAGLLFLGLAAWAGYRVVPESSPVARGAAYAQVHGCISCHGDPEGPLADADKAGCSNTGPINGHPEYEAACGDVMAYFETVRLRRTFAARMQANTSGPLIAGEKLAREYHCFQCHGHLGQGGFANAKSLKGYVPGYFGTDFRMLTRNANPDSVREWITHGLDRSIVEQPITGWVAGFFLAREAISMPGYQSLCAEEIEILVAYVIAINQFGPMDANAVRRYGELTKVRP
jgi:mono/diheme cytochrome c family protein